MGPAVRCFAELERSLLTMTALRQKHPLALTCQTRRPQLGLGYRHSKAEPDFAHFRCNIERSAIRSSNFSCNKQPQSKTLQRIFHSAPIEWLKQLRHRSGWDWIAGVHDGQFKYSIFGRGARQACLAIRASPAISMMSSADFACVSSRTQEVMAARGLRKS
jgi:hypothetical protein